MSLVADNGSSGHGRESTGSLTHRPCDQLTHDRSNLPTSFSTLFAIRVRGIRHDKHATKRRAVVRRAARRPAAAAVDRHLLRPPGPQQQTRRPLLQRSTVRTQRHGQTDRQIDGRTLYRDTDPTAYYDSSANKRGASILTNFAVRQKSPFGN